MKLRAFLFIILLLMLASINFAQSKPDSTQFKYWVNEFNQTQSKLATLDTVKIKLHGMLEYQYSKAVEEKQKIDTFQSAENNKKAKK